MRNLRLNGLTENAITIVPDAVSSRRGEAEFMDKDYGSSLVLKPGRKTLRVRTMTLDDVLEMTGRVEIMKMDIQGEELNALRPAAAALAAGTIATLIVGTHSDDLHAGVLTLLKECGGEVILDEPRPEHQPDGLVIAKFGT